MTRKLCAVGAVPLLLSGFVVGCGSVPVEDSAGDDVEVAVTPRPTDEVDSEIAEIAENRGVSIDEAESAMETQVRLSDFADEAIDKPGVLQFQFTAGGGGGVLIVEPDFDVDAEFPQIAEVSDLEVHHAELSADQREAAQAAVADHFERDSKASGELVGLPPYDGYLNEFTVWMESLDDIDVGALTEELEQQVRDASDSNTVRVRVAESGDIRPVPG